MCLIPFDKLICWLKVNEGNICKNPQMTKKYRELIKKIENCRKEAFELGTKRCYLEQVMLCISKLNVKPDQYLDIIKECISDQLGDIKRRIDNVFKTGFFTQGIVTRWFYESEYQIIDIEKGKKKEYDFDIEIEDKNGNRYDIEVWERGGIIEHKIKDSMFRIAQDENGNIISKYKGVNKDTKYVSELGGVSDGPVLDDLCKLLKKIKQLRKGHTGFLIACGIGKEISAKLPLHHPGIPSEWGLRLPEKKCVIVLRFDDLLSETRGIGYIVHPPRFDNIETAKNIIQSLKFEYVKDSDVIKRLKE